MKTDQKLGKWYLSKDGFGGIGFQDRNYQLCSIEMATLVEGDEATAKDRIYLGINGHRMDLSREQVEALQWVMETWLCEGGKKS